MSLRLGIDIGSTTVKVVVLDGEDIIFSKYERHASRTREKAAELLREASKYVKSGTVYAAMSGSAGLGLSTAAGLQFVQEVFATGEAVRARVPDADVVIELGGEDAKILFMRNPVEERMNGTCAGGTGAFIDQMATLLNVDASELDRLSLGAVTIYPIASRCGVFAKSDIQPLINQGARREDIAASIFQAVVDQTVAGLAQGRRIAGRVVFLGGPLHFCRGLRRRFTETLRLGEDDAVFPDFSLYTVAIGAAMQAQLPMTMTELLERVERAGDAVRDDKNRIEPLFRDRDEYDAFTARHAAHDVKRLDPALYTGEAFIGVDCGSTTTKIALVADSGELLYDYYSPNRGNPVDIVREQLIKIRTLCSGHIEIVGCASTGYGEELIKQAFSMDMGVVETVAHMTAAMSFEPEVDFLLDIGGQDIKCFKIHNGAIDSIMLNEACSSGCGSFVETFAKSLGYEVDRFTEMGLFAKAPCDLGSRCTVFMNSSIKQAQKDGACVEDISAGLSISVVKNAIYKVIRASSAASLGRHIVVQGGTFLNDAVLRAFEREIGADAVRPVIAGLMGAYGAALYAKSNRPAKCALLTMEQLDDFVHTAKSVSCGGCTNRCSLTVNTFANGARFISGNRCEKPLGGKKRELPNIYKYKRDRIAALMESSRDGGRGKIGLALGLNMFENIPIWHTLLTDLGFEVALSGLSTPETIGKGRPSIASDTVCYPAKLIHGHIESLIEKGIDTIFYPCMTYNVDEGKGDNHYNCPVVAYYPELLRSNMESLGKVRFLQPFLSFDNERVFVRSLCEALREVAPDIRPDEVRRAARRGFEVYRRWHEELVKEGEKYLAFARANGLRTAVLAGRPYHIDPEINHGIDTLLGTLDFVVISEDCIADKSEPYRAGVLNQWTYHARLYNAARWVCRHDDVELVQLVSFGCGLDAITTDEVREILEDSGRIYTQLKIDDVNNLGAMTIRLRSLKAAAAMRAANAAQREAKHA